LSDSRPKKKKKKRRYPPELIPHTCPAVAGCQTTPSTTTTGRVDDRAVRFNTETAIIAASVTSVLVLLAIVGVSVYVIRR